MSRRFLFIFLFWLASGAAWAAPAAPVILVVGDSLSAGYGIDVDDGWVALLAARLRDQGYPQRVVNASISGDTTASGRTRLPAALERHRPAIVILALGANDGLRGLPIDAMRDNLAAMIRAAQRRGARVLLVGIHIPTNYGKEYTERFHAVYGELAKRYRTALVPFLLDGVALEPALMQADGLHPAPAAQPRLLDNVWPKLTPLLR
jgi:acyl-CoA thioesterase-1